MSNSVYIEIVFQKNKPKSAYAVICFKKVFSGKKLLLTLLFITLNFQIFFSGLFRKWQHLKRQKTPKKCVVIYANLHAVN
jgi:hypothetical protein